MSTGTHWARYTQEAEGVRVIQ